MNINLTLIAQLVSFAVFVWFTMKFVWPPLVKAMDERKAKIAEGLAAAERGQHEQELAEKRAKDYPAQGEATGRRDQVQRREAGGDDHRRGPRQGQGRRRAAAGRRPGRDRAGTNKAREVLRSKVAELAVLGAEKILRKEINADAHQRHRRIRG